ncbi:MAG TPA: polysaccharide biosynthesis/export family protein [Opitutus sp.]|nr:polysaccharide biosynthesis/export family protein [Opitutus sp.]
MLRSLRFLSRPFLLTLLALTATLSLRAQEQPGAAVETEKSNYVYRLTITDRIRISIFQEDDLATMARVDARGNVNLKLVGDLYVAGMTVAEAQHAIEKAYRDGRYLRNPQASIAIEDYAPREVSISGQVKAPGRYLLPIESTFSIVELVTKAGGLTDIAKGTNVIVTRTSSDGKMTTLTVDVDALIRGRKSNNPDNAAILLEPGDVVYVPERII